MCAMAARKTDRRTQRTRQALLSAFVELVLAGGYASATVEQIAERADTGRSTFYMHFKSKEDILKQSLTRPSMPLALIVGHDVTPDMLVHQLLHFQEQRPKNKVFFSAPIRQIWVKCLADLIEPRLATVSREARATNPILPLGLIATQIAEAQIALVTNWLTGRATLKPLAIAEALIATTRATMIALLRCRPDAPLFIAGEKLRIVQH
jgi:AcrR family transcriptional regulator